MNFEWEKKHKIVHNFIEFLGVSFHTKCSCFCTATFVIRGDSAGAHIVPSRCIISSSDKETIISRHEDGHLNISSL